MVCLGKSYTNFTWSILEYFVPNVTQYSTSKIQNINKRVGRLVKGVNKSWHRTFQNFKIICPLLVLNSQDQFVSWYGIIIRLQDSRVIA